MSNFIYEIKKILRDFIKYNQQKELITKYDETLNIINK